MGGDIVKQMKHTVTYRDNDREKELFEFVESKSEIIGPSNAIKVMLNELMIQEKENKNNGKRNI